VILDRPASIVPFAPQAASQPVIAFDRHELGQILRIYGLNVATGEWRDYAMDFNRDRAVFSIFRRASENPLYSIIKNPALSRKQGTFAVITQDGLVLKRGHDLQQVLTILLKKPKLASL
jgi:Protein of unknown function (DUF2794)